MEKKKPGRKQKYNEPTIKLNWRVPLGAVAGINKVIKDYLDLYQATKQAKILSKDE